MSAVSQLPSFPNTIANLPDRPGLSAANMKEALQRDVAQLWQKTEEIVEAVNDKPDISGGGAIYVGNTSPASVADTLSAGDIYLYVPDLP